MRLGFHVLRLFDFQKVADGIRTEKLLSGIVDAANVKSAVSRVTTIKNAQTTLSLYDALGSKDSDNKTEEIIDQTGEYDAIRFRILDLKAEYSRFFYVWGNARFVCDTDLTLPEGIHCCEYKNGTEHLFALRSDAAETLTFDILGRSVTLAPQDVTCVVCDMA